MDPTYKGAAFSPDGKGGARVCSLELGPGSLWVRTGSGDEISWPYASLSVSHAGEERSHLLLTCPPVASSIGSVTVRDPLFAAALAEKVPPHLKPILSRFDTDHRRHVRNKWRNLVLAGLGFAALLVGGYAALSTFVADWAAQKMPVSLEIQWGRALSTAFLATKKEVRDGAAFDAAQAIFARLKGALPKDQPYPLEVHLVDDPMVNAFALPGGQVMLMTGLMKEARGPEEVAGVLAHELQHVLKRHVVKRLVQDLGWRAWFAVFFGGSDLSNLVFGAGTLLQLSYGRGQESEADLEGAKLLHKAGLPVQPLADFFDRLSAREGETGKMPAFISTHPESRERVKKLRELASSLPPGKTRPFNIDWLPVQKALGSAGTRP